MQVCLNKGKGSDYSSSEPDEHARGDGAPLAFRYMARALLRRRRVRIVAWTVGGTVLAAGLLVGDGRESWEPQRPTT